MLKFLLLILFYSFSVLAELNVSPTIKIEEEGAKWFSSYSDKITKLKTSEKYPENGYRECRELSEVPGTFICLNASKEETNQALGRASIYAEGAGEDLAGVLIKKGTVVDKLSSAIIKYTENVSGLDIKGQDLTAFYMEAMSKCECDQSSVLTKCLNGAENEVFDGLIMQIAAKNKPFVVISSPFNSIATIKHEIFHAQYFLQPKFREIADKFWEDEVSFADKEEMTKELAQYYDIRDKVLLRNEFQAFLLEGYPSDTFDKMVPIYQEKLRKKLSDAGVPPVKITDK